MNAQTPLRSRHNDMGKTWKGRKRARNKSLRRFASNNSFFLPLTATGIAAIFSLNVTDDPASFAFAFNYSANLFSKVKQANSFVPSENGSRLQKHRNLRRNRYTENFRGTLDDTIDNGNYDTLEDGNERRITMIGRDSSDHRSSGSSSHDSTLVFASSSPLHSTSRTFSSSHLPPWLSLLEEEFAGLKSLSEASNRIRREIEFLEKTLLSFRGNNFFSKDDAREIIRAIYWCASSISEERNATQKASKIVAIVSFCNLLLQLEEDTFDVKKYQENYGNINMNNNNSSDDKSDFITKDVLLASILHFSECVDFRYDGVYDEVRNALQKDPLLEQSSDNNLGHSPKSYDLAMLPMVADNEKADDSIYDTKIVLVKNANEYRTTSGVSHPLRSSREPMQNKNNDAFEKIFSRESLELASAAMKLKQIEILTTVTLTSRGAEDIKRRPLSKEEYSAVRNLMVSLTDDWRALAIRCVASLYRLEGILKHMKINAGTGQFAMHHSRRSAEITLTAKDSLQMYANLSQQMGLYRLRTQLEAKAFRIIYPRQYSASSLLFQEHGTAMETLSEFLSNQLKQLLYEDLSLMHELENLEVVSRVKEPYSFWKKILKKKIRPIATTAINIDQRTYRNDSGDNVDEGAEQHDQKIQMIPSSTDLSILEVNDGVALRVILKARKLHADEPAIMTQERERLLCYYIHHMVRSKWPETNLNRVKDYIRYPKANGYQSLHHTSRITMNKQDFFFEVQIRSEEMHRFAEFGVAAHSAYKLGGSGGGSGSPTIFPTLKPSVSSPSLPMSTVVSSFEAEKLNSFNESSAMTIPSTGENSIADSYDPPIIGLSNYTNSGPYIKALGKTRQNLIKSYVYVFLVSSTFETGQLLTLPAGSLISDVLDTLREVNEEFSFKDHDICVWCNGKFALLQHAITNGDTILIKPKHASSSPTGKAFMNKTASNIIVVS